VDCFNEYSYENVHMDMITNRVLNAIPAGIYGVWGSELDIILDPVGIGQVCRRYIWISKNEI
jgi:hypothetical protein